MFMSVLHCFKSPVSEADIWAAHPDKNIVASVLGMAKIVSTRGTNPLGNFDFQHQYNPTVLSFEQM